MKKLLLVFILLTLTAKIFARSPMEDPYKMAPSEISIVREHVQRHNLETIHERLKVMKPILDKKRIELKSIEHYRNLNASEAEDELVEIIMKVRKSVNK
jgi:hypothetical protein